MTVSDALERAISGLKSAAGMLVGTKGYSSAHEGFVCVACHSTYDRQHYQCPQCGEMVLVPLDADEADEADGPGERPG